MGVVSVRVRPGASRTEVIGLVEGVWQIRVAAPPVEGKANAALVKFLSQVLDVPKSAVCIRHGERSRVKVVDIEGRTQAQVDSQLQEASRN